MLPKPIEHEVVPRDQDPFHKIASTWNKNVVQSPKISSINKKQFLSCKSQKFNILFIIRIETLKTI